VRGRCVGDRRGGRGTEEREVVGCFIDWGGSRGGSETCEDGKILGLRIAVDVLRFLGTSICHLRVFL